MMLLKFLALSALLVTANSFQPNCNPYNQFRFQCFPIQYCNSYTCKTDQCGRFDRNSEIVRIKETRVIPKCAFTNANYLLYIYGVNSKIRVLASGSFENLPRLKEIHLSFNLIRELHRGIFKNVTLSSLDLSWNKIVYVEEGAFRGLKGLNYLNLSQNELMTFPVHQIPSKLKEINLSYNLFNRIVLNSRRCPNLTSIDLSHNVIENVALSFENPVKKIDLTQNNLEKIDFMDVPACEELKIGLNKFSSTPEILTYLNVRRLSLYPNPWSCAELQNLWSYLRSNFVTLTNEKKSNATREDTPICTANSSKLLLGASAKLTTRISDNTEQCQDDSQCDDNMLCRSWRCWNPCNENVCDPTSACKITNHDFVCFCPGSLKRNPKDVYSPCIAAECFYFADCGRDSYCIDNKCYKNNLFGKAPEGNRNIQKNPVPTESPKPWWYYEIPKHVPSSRRN